jgi:uncharacterized protein (DUF169 family)
MTRDDRRRSAMDMELKKRFLEKWDQYFGGSELPITFYYADQEGKAQKVEPPSAHQCFIGVLARVRSGETLCFDIDSVGCFGGKRYLGFTEKIRPKFEYFLSCGTPGEMEGERYKKSPEMVNEIMKKMPKFKAPCRYILFKRWDLLEETDEPEVVIFFSKPDVLSGLYALAGFDEIDLNGVVAPFGAGCATIVQYPYIEKDAVHPKAVLGMFDVSARPYAPKDTLTLSVPMKKFRSMVDNMEESFLITGSWDKVRKRISA